MSSMKITVLVILCFAIAVSSCYGQQKPPLASPPQSQQQQKDPDYVLVELYTEKDYQGANVNIPYIVNPRSDCERVPNLVYAQISSLKTHGQSVMVAFYGKNDCQGRALLETYSGLKIPDLEQEGLDNVFKSYKIYN